MEPTQKHHEEDIQRDTQVQKVQLSDFEKLVQQQRLFMDQMKPGDVDWHEFDLEKLVQEQKLFREKSKRDTEEWQELVLETFKDLDPKQLKSFVTHPWIEVDVEDEFDTEKLMQEHKLYIEQVKRNMERRQKIADELFKEQDPKQQHVDDVEPSCETLLDFFISKRAALLDFFISKWCCIIEIYRSKKTKID